MVSVGVIGSGAWGTTLACLLAKKGIETTLWEHRPERAIEMQQQRENTLFLPGIRFPAMLYVTSQVAEAAREKDMLLLVTPSQRMRENVRLLAPYVGKGTLLVSATKGIEINSLERMTEVIAEELPQARSGIAALSGPNISREVAEGKPTAAVVAADEEEIAVRARTILNTANFRVYTANDLVGVELGGALKNVIAIGAGFNDGMGYGDSAKAAFITRGVAEMSRLGIAAGAHPLTLKLDAILASMHSVAEGVYTTKAALQLAARYDVEMPITQQLSLVLFEGLDPRKAMPELMMRDPKSEMEGIVDE